MSDAVTEQDEVDGRVRLCRCGQGYEGHVPDSVIAQYARQLTAIGVTPEGGVIVGPQGWANFARATHQSGAECLCRFEPTPATCPRHGAFPGGELFTAVGKVTYDDETGELS